LARRDQGHASAILRGVDAVLTDISALSLINAVVSEENQSSFHHVETPFS
jgi:hypothetical protein